MPSADTCVVTHVAIECFVLTVVLGFVYDAYSRAISPAVVKFRALTFVAVALRIAEYSYLNHAGLYLLHGLLGYLGVAVGVPGAMYFLEHVVLALATTGSNPKSNSKLVLLLSCWRLFRVVIFTYCLIAAIVFSTKPTNRWQVPRFFGTLAAVCTCFLPAAFIMGHLVYVLKSKAHSLKEDCHAKQVIAVTGDNPRPELGESGGTIASTEWQLWLLILLILAFSIFWARSAINNLLVLFEDLDARFQHNPCAFNPSIFLETIATLCALMLTLCPNAPPRNPSSAETPMALDWHRSSGEWVVERNSKTGDPRYRQGDVELAVKSINDARANDTGAAICSDSGEVFHLESDVGLGAELEKPVSS